MIRACILGMCNGEYVFVYPWLHPPPEQEWQRGDEYDEIAKEAYKYMIHVSKFGHQIHVYVQEHV